MPDILDPDQLLKPGADSPKEEPVVPPPAPTEPPAPTPDSLPQLAPAPPPPAPEPTPPPVAEAKPEPPPPAAGQAKKRPIGVLIATFLILASAVFFSSRIISQQRQLADIRSLAATDPCKECNSSKKCVKTNIPNCGPSLNQCAVDADCQGVARPTPTPKPKSDCRATDCGKGKECIPVNNKWQCVDLEEGSGGRKCGATTCTKSEVCIEGNCYGPGGEYCQDKKRGMCVSPERAASNSVVVGGKTIPGYLSCTKLGALDCATPEVCVKCDGGGSTTTDDGGGGGGGGGKAVCRDIKIYKGDTEVDPSTLKAGDAVVLALKGLGNPTKARFRVNGGAWTETTTKNGKSEYTLDFTVPSGVTQFTIEGELFVLGKWR